MTGSWGRWGPQDERGALNLVDDAAVRRGLAAVTRGTTVSLGLPLRSGQGPVAGFRAPVQHLMTRDGGDYAAGLPERPGYGFADDVLILPCHGTTHLDALAHVWRDGVMWNGHSASTVTSRGAARCGIDKAGPVVTRGLFVDLVPPGEVGLDDGTPITADMLSASLRRAGVSPQPGDALIVRTGWLPRWRDGAASVDAWPGLDGDCVDLIVEEDIALVGADNIAVEVGPSTTEGSAMPLHLALSRDRGVPFLELLDLELLATHGPTTFLLVVAPLNLVGGTASPVAPVAVL